MAARRRLASRGRTSAILGVLIAAASLPGATAGAAAEDTARAPLTVACTRTTQAPLALRALCAHPADALPASVASALSAATPARRTLDAPAPTRGADPPVCVRVPGVDDRCEAWSATYDNPAGHSFDGPGGTSGYAGADRIMGVALAPSGERVFATGISFDAATGYDAVTIAYDAATGAERWVARYDGPGARELADGGIAITTSGDGSRVFVAGYRDLETRSGQTPSGEFLVLALDAATGAQVWAATHDGTAQGDAALAIALAPDGGSVYVAGVLDTRANARDADIGTIALDAQTGATRWSARYDGGYGDYPLSVAPTPAGDRVVVGGTSYFRFNPPSTSLTLEFLALAYDAVGTGAGVRAWSGTYHPVNPSGMGLLAQTMAVAFGPDAVYLTGVSDHPATPVFDAVGATAAWDTATGALRWVKTSKVGIATAILGATASASGDRLYLTGLVTDSLSPPSVDYDFGTWALDSGSGAQAWFARHRGPRDDWAWGASVAAPSEGGRVIVAGLSASFAASQLGPPLRGDYATLAYNAATGAQAWVARFNGSPAMTDLEADPRVWARATVDGSRAFTSGTLIRQPSGINYSDYGIAAYDV